MKRIPRKITVLIVEDEVIQTLFLKKILKELGYKVIAKVTTGEQAVKVALEDSPDVITMDIFLEGKMDGISAVEEIHKHASIPVIYISGNSDKQNYERAKKTKFVDFLPKPISKSDLAQSFTMIRNSLRLNQSKAS